mgnify:CR=1 FL=1
MNTRKYVILGTMLLVTFVLGAFSAAWSSAGFPNKPIRIIVPFGAGDAIDGTARVMAERIQAEFKIPVIVQNIAGGGGAIGIAEAARAPSDGYTLVMGSTGALTASPLISSSGYETDDFEPLAQLVEVPLGLAVREQSNFKSISDLIEAARNDSVTYSTPAPGTTQHINMSQFANTHGLNLTHVGGKGGKGALTKALTGEVDFVFIGASNYVSLAKAGKIRVLGVTSDERLYYLPDAPTFEEQGYPFNAAVWFGLLVRKGTPDDIIEKLKETIRKTAKDEKTIEMYRKFYFTDAFLPAELFQKRIESNVKNHKHILKEIGLIK